MYWLEYTSVCRRVCILCMHGTGYIPFDVGVYVYTDQGIPPSWRDFHSASAIGDLMYVFGGRSDRGGAIHTNSEIYCNKIKVFNTLTYEWFSPATTGEAPKGRRSHAACKLTIKMYKLS